MQEQVQKASVDDTSTDTVRTMHTAQYCRGGYTETDKCNQCDGTGKKTRVCGGTTATWTVGTKTMSRPCPTCGGTSGWNIIYHCEKCGNEVADTAAMMCSNCTSRGPFGVPRS